MSTSNIRIDTADAVEFLKSLDDESVDLFFFDPPYESIEKHRKVGTTTRLKESKSSSNPWFKCFPNARLPELFEQVHRVLKKNRHAYMMCDQETLFVAKPIAEAAGFKFWKAVIWDRMVLGMGYHYRGQHELVMFLEKGKRKLHNLAQSDVIRVERLRGKAFYPSEKPPGLVRVFVEQSSQHGEIVCDPFMGSGVTGDVAVATGRRFWGSDLNPDAVSRSIERIVEAAGDFRGRETVRCANPRCDSVATIKQLNGIPSRWFGVWDPQTACMRRVCSEQCIRATKTNKGEPKKRKGSSRPHKRKS